VINLDTSSARISYHLEDVTFYCILGAVIFLPISIEAFSFFLFAGAAFWAGKIAFMRKVLWRRNSLDKIIFVYVFLSALSIVNAPDKNFSVYNYSYLMGKYILTYYLITNNINCLKRLRLLVYGLLGSSVVVVMYGFYQYFFAIDISSFLWVDKSQFPELKTRVFSTLGNPNLLAGFLLVIISLSFSLSLYENRPNIKTCLATLTIAAGLCLIMTYSRGVWLSLLATLFIYGKFYDKRIFLTAIPVLAIVVFSDGEILTRATSIINPVDSSSALRLAMWDSTLHMIREQPILGIGWGSYWLVYPNYDYFIKNESVIIYHAHNMYLHLAAETGILGLTAFLAVLYGHIRLAFRIFSKKNLLTTDLMLGVLAAMTGLIVSGFTDYLLFSAQMSLVFWFLNAIVIGAYQLSPKTINLERK